MEGIDDDTPPNGTRIATIEATSIAALALAMQSVAEHCFEAARSLDTIEPADRPIYLARLSQKLRECGDLGHDAARVIEQIGKGAK